MTKRFTEVAAADAEKVVAIVCREIDRCADEITTEASWARLEAFFYEALQHRKSIPAATIVMWGYAGHPAADRAIRRYAGEMIDQHREGELLSQVRSYAVQRLLQPFIPYPRGRHVVGNLMRNLWLGAVLDNVAAGTGLNPTRSATTAAPSAAYFVHLAYKRRGTKLKEQEINRIYWHRHKVAGALEASMPAISTSN
jgi:hypothetical protein